MLQLKKNKKQQQIHLEVRDYQVLEALEEP